VFYQIKVKTNIKSWTVERQFVEFINLANDFEKSLLAVPKTLLKSKLTKEELNNFLKEIVSRPELLNQQSTYEFLMVYNHVIV